MKLETKISVTKWAYIILKIIVTVYQLTLFIINGYQYSENMGFFFVTISIILVQIISSFIGMLTYEYKFPGMLFWELGIILAAASLYSTLTVYNLMSFYKSEYEELRYQHGNKSYELEDDGHDDYLINATHENPLETLTNNAIDSFKTAQRNVLKYLTGKEISADESNKNQAISMESSEESVDGFYQTFIFKFLLLPSYVTVGIQILVLLSLSFYRYYEKAKRVRELHKAENAAIRQKLEDFFQLENEIPLKDFKKGVDESEGNIPLEKSPSELGEHSKALDSQARKVSAMTTIADESSAELVTNL